MKRFAAGLVEVAVLVAVVWVAATGGPWAGTDRATTGSTGHTQTPITARPTPSTPVGATVASDARVGFIGLPPRGSRPSAPENGELVLSFAGWPTPTGFLHRVWIYADGRLIWLRHGDLPQGANHHLTGFLEQRLSAEGVERFLSEVTSTALLDDGSQGGEPIPWYIDVEVRSDGGLVRVERTRAVSALITRFVDPASWLPASAWEDPEVRAYVPSRHAVCVEAASPGPIEPTAISTVLPASIDGSLRASALDPVPGDLAQGHGRVLRCSAVTTEEARSISRALEAAGFEPDGVGAHRLTYRSSASQPNGAPISIWFEPYLPHGQAINSVVGERGV